MCVSELISNRLARMSLVDSKSHFFPCVTITHFCEEEDRLLDCIRKPSISYDFLLSDSVNYHSYTKNPAWFGCGVQIPRNISSQDPFHLMMSIT